MEFLGEKRVMKSLMTYVRLDSFMRDLRSVHYMLSKVKRADSLSEREMSFVKLPREITPLV